MASTSTNYGGIIIDFFQDGSGNYITKPVSNETHKVLNGYITLTLLPDKSPRVQVNLTNAVEIDISSEITSATEYKVDYNNGQVFFHTSQEGKTFSFNYTGQGIILTPASRIYDDTSNNTGVVKTLGDIITASKDIISDLSNTMTKAVYDTNNDGKVNSADISDNALKLNGQDGSYYTNRANQNGTQTHDTISDFDTAVKTTQITVNDSISEAEANVGELVKQLSWIVKEIKSIKGSADWKTAAVDTLVGLQTKLGDLSLLTTGTHSSLVNAINELKAEINLGGSVDNANHLSGHEANYFLQRANHEGTQLSTTISDFVEAVQDIIGSIFADSNTIDFTYDDANNTIKADVKDNTSTQKVQVYKDGTLIGTRKAINYKTNSNATINITDNATDDRTDIEIIPSGGTADKVTVADTASHFTSTPKNVENVLAEIANKTEILQAPNPNALKVLNGWIDNSGGIITSAYYPFVGYEFICSSSNNSTSAKSMESEKILCNPNYKLALSGYFYTAGITSGGIQLNINAYDTSGNLLNTGSIEPVNGLTSHTRYSIIYTTPANTNYIKVSVSIKPNTINSLAVWRSIKLEMSTTANTTSVTPYSQEADIAYLYDKTNILSTPYPNLCPNSSAQYEWAKWTDYSNGKFTITTSSQQGSFWDCNSGVGTSMYIDSDSIVIGANKALTVSCEVITAGLTGNIYIEVVAFNSSGTVLGDAISLKMSNSSSDFVKYSNTGNTPANTAYVKVRFYIPATATFIDIAWRRFKLELGSVATPYSQEADMQYIQNEIGNLSSLTTPTKTDLVSAINSIGSKVQLAKGSYTGNNATTQYINCGFVPDVVWIFNYYSTGVTVNSTQIFPLCVDSTFILINGSTPVNAAEIYNTGFNAKYSAVANSGIHTNDSGKIYGYVAIKLG